MSTVDFRCTSVCDDAFVLHINAQSGVHYKYALG